MYGSNAGRARRARTTRTGAGVALGALLLLAGCSSSSPSSAAPPKGDTVPQAPAQQPKTRAPFWVNPESTASKRSVELRKDGKDQQAQLLSKIAAQPVAEWIGVDDPQGQTRG